MNTINRVLPVLSIDPSIYYSKFVLFADKQNWGFPYFYTKQFPQGTKNNI